MPRQILLLWISHKIEVENKVERTLEFVETVCLNLLLNTTCIAIQKPTKVYDGKENRVVKNEHIGRLAYEMRLNKWLIMSRNAEEKKTRTNLKKLGCLFEAFLGALFLDFNKISVKDEHGWFQNVFVTGPGFQMAQIFVENVFEQHVDFVKLVATDDNFKNILLVRSKRSSKQHPNI